MPKPDKETNGYIGGVKFRDYRTTVISEKYHINTASRVHPSGRMPNGIGIHNWKWGARIRGSSVYCEDIVCLCMKVHRIT